MKYALALLAMMLWVWMWWSGHYTVDHVLLRYFMVGSCLLVLWIVGRMNGFTDETAPIAWLNPIEWAKYVPWLAWEIIKSNIDVTRRILSPSLPIQRQLIRVRATQRTDIGRTVFANSIILTPGTVSVIVENDEILVHAISDSTAQGLLTGEMDRRVTEFEPGRAKLPGAPLEPGTGECAQVPEEAGGPGADGDGDDGGDVAGKDDT